ncbi:MAG: transposase [Candidatus Schekmanbacteria bacterium]|nr:transposase [Candidatus Schekmanbacteria bacterium]
MPHQQDSVWKDLLDRYLEPFLAFFFPAVHADVDWCRPPESLDKEFQRIVRDSTIGVRLADKLVKVWLRDGKETWLLVHLEVERRPGPEFPERIYVYGYRIFDRYRRPVISLALLTDVGRGYRAALYRVARWGFSLRLRFPVVKIADYRDRREALEQDPNPFALVVLAHLAVQDAKGSMPDLRDSKLRLVRLLFRRGYARAQVLELLRFLDWLVALPEDLEVVFWAEVEKLEEEASMPHVLSIERIAEKRGREEGIAVGEAKALLAVLAVRGLPLTEAQRNRILSCESGDCLERWLRRAVTASSAAEVFEEAS